MAGLEEQTQAYVRRQALVGGEGVERGAVAQQLPVVSQTKAAATGGNGYCMVTERLYIQHPVVAERCGVIRSAAMMPELHVPEISAQRTGVEPVQCTCYQYLLWGNVQTAHLVALHVSRPSRQTIVFMEEHAVVLLPQVVHIQSSLVGGYPKTLLAIFNHVVDVVATQTIGVILVMDVALDGVAFTRFRGLESSQSIRLCPQPQVTNYTRGTLDERFKFLDTKPVFAGAHLLFGTTQGVLSVSPQEMQKSSYQPPLVFDCPSDIRLSSDERSLTIQFAALDFNKNVPITYAYRIEGMDNRWSYITDNHITLPDIPAGTVRLHLRSTNGDGVWADNEQTLTIHRRAAFHETPWAWMLYGLLLTLLVIGIYRVVRYIRRLQNEIKDIRLTSNQRIEVMSERIRELLSIREKIEAVSEQQEHIENDEDHRFSEHIRTYISDHLADSDLSVQDIANEMAVSRTVLFARMKSIFGTSPNNYLLNRRIERAKELLRQPGAYITDIAYRSGFSDPKYFSKCFKKLTGQTPSEFQKL